MQLDSVGDRDAHTRYIQDDHLNFKVGDRTIYFDQNTESYWFDSNGNGTIETQFWIDSSGTVWYDINNDGNGDTIVNVEGYP